MLHHSGHVHADWLCGSLLQSLPSFSTCPYLQVACGFLYQQRTTHQWRVHLEISGLLSVKPLLWPMASCNPARSIGHLKCEGCRGQYFLPHGLPGYCWVAGFLLCLSLEWSHFCIQEGRDIGCRRCPSVWVKTGEWDWITQQSISNGQGRVSLYIWCYRCCWRSQEIFM